MTVPVSLTVESETEKEWAPDGEQPTSTVSVTCQFELIIFAGSPTQEVMKSAHGAQKEGVHQVLSELVGSD